MELVLSMTRIVFREANTQHLHCKLHGFSYWKLADMMEDGVKNEGKMRRTQTLALA